MKLRQPLLALLFIEAFAMTSFSQTILLEGKTYKGKLLKNENHTYIITVEKGGEAALTVMQQGVDAAIDLFDPESKKIKTFDSPNGNEGPEPISFVALSAGNYQVHIYPLINESGTESEKEKLKEQNQGDYEINDITILSATDYQQKLAKEKEIWDWAKENANTITKPDLSITAKIFDLQFTEQEIDSMYDNVKELNQGVKQLHSLPLDKSIHMSI